MAKRVYVSSHESDFFINNTIDCAPSIPNEGDHKAGDLIISSIQQDEIIGWVCVKDGNPGEWDTIRNAGKWLDVELNKINDDISEIKILIKDAQSQLVLILEQIQENKDSIISLNNEMKEANSLIEQHRVLIGEIEVDIEEINSQINVTKQTLTVLTTQVNNNSEAINTIHTSVGENGVASKDSVDDIITQIDKLKEMLGINDSSGEGSEKGILQQLEELRELIGANAEGDEEAKEGILQQLEELKELIGANAEEGEEARGGIIEDITNLQNLVGTPARGEDPATGLHREIENLQESIEEVKDEYLKFWVGTNAEYQALTRVEHGRLYIIID